MIVLWLTCFTATVVGCSAYHLGYLVFARYRRNKQAATLLEIINKYVQENPAELPDINNKVSEIN